MKETLRNGCWSENPHVSKEWRDARSRSGTVSDNAVEDEPREPAGVKEVSRTLQDQMKAGQGQEGGATEEASSKGEDGGVEHKAEEEEGSRRRKTKRMHDPR